MSRSAAKTRGDKSRCSSVPMSAHTPPENVESADIVPGRLTEKAWLSMLAQEDGEEVVAETLSKLESTVLDKCYQVYLQKQRVPFTISWARDRLLDIINWQFLEKDNGEESMSFWEEDPEPEPCAFDAWAQGSVPVCYSGASSYTPLLQELLDLHSAKSDNLLDPDSQSETSTAVKTNRSCLARNVSEMGKLESTEGLQNTSPCPAGPFKTTQRRKQPQPSPSKGIPSLPKTQKTRPVESLAQGLITARLLDKATPPTQPCEHRNRNIPVAKRLNTANLPQHQVWPEVEVLEPRPLWGTPKLNEVNHNPVRPATTPHPDLQRFPNNQRKIQGTWGKELHDDAKPGNLKSGFTSDALALDTIALARGVALRDPASVGNQEEIHPTWVPQLPELKPVRSSFLPHLWSLDQLVSGQRPRVISPTGPHRA